MLTVPIIKSAIKRVSVNNRQRQENRGAKSRLATEIKKFRTMVEANKLEAAAAYLPSVVLKYSAVSNVPEALQSYPLFAEYHPESFSISCSSACHLL